MWGGGDKARYKLAASSSQMVENELFLPNLAPSSITVNLQPIWKVSKTPEWDQSHKQSQQQAFLSGLQQRQT